MRLRWSRSLRWSVLTLHLRRSDSSSSRAWSRSCSMAILVCRRRRTISDVVVRWLTIAVWKLSRWTWQLASSSWQRAISICMASRCIMIDSRSNPAGTPWGGVCDYGCVRLWERRLLVTVDSPVRRVRGYRLLYAMEHPSNHPFRFAAFQRLGQLDPGRQSPSGLYFFEPSFVQREGSGLRGECCWYRRKNIKR